MSKVQFELMYNQHDGFQWKASMTLDGRTFVGWGESLERAAQKLEWELENA